jgi:hypothetical protein
MKKLNKIVVKGVKITAEVQKISVSQEGGNHLHKLWERKDVFGPIPINP